MPGIITNKHFRKAKNFLDELRLSNRRWWDFYDTSAEPDQSWVRSWYFRGQADASWELIPSAWRINNQQYFEIARNTIFRFENALSFQAVLRNKWDELGLSPADTVRWNRTAFILSHAVAENMFINEFWRLSGEIGHHIPPSRDWRTPTIELMTDYLNGYFQNNNESIWTHPIVALAQHHRIPTRLLDWTKNPLCAAFFAAADVADNPNPGGRIAVFALNERCLGNDLKLVRVPGNEIDFLRAQGGVFIYDATGDDIYVRQGHYPTLEQTWINVPDNPIIQPELKKLTLPQTEARELIRLLWLEGITKAHLMPTLDNVAEAVKIKWRLVN